jgi:hypothetical protein
MNVVRWHGRRDARLDPVPDPLIDESTDAVVRMTPRGTRGSLRT